MLKIRDMSVQYGEKPPAVAHFDLHMKKHEIDPTASRSTLWPWAAEAMTVKRVILL